MTRPGVVGTLVWAILACSAALIVLRASYTTDLSAFLPRTPTATQRMLVEQLREGFASRLIMMAIEGSDSKTRAQVSIAMARRLRGDAAFVTVNNGESADVERDRAFLFDHRYLLSETALHHFTVEGLHAAISDTLDLLASPAGLMAKALLTRDPTGEMLQILDQLGGNQGPRTVAGAWSSKDGRRALLVAQTRASGSDTDGQEHAIQLIQQAFTAALNELPESQGRGLTLEMSGPGVFSVAARATIKGEVVRLSAVSTLIIVMLLLAVYRSVPALILGLVPVASGALAGVAAVALGFGVVHGITLGFGVTLIGEAVDYSIYLFVQSRARVTSPESWQRSVWPTIRLGMLTSICGFASLLPSGFPGLAQLGLYSIGGLVAAALVTRFVLPYWLPPGFAIRDPTPLGVVAAAGLQRLTPARALLLAVPIFSGIVLYTHWDSLWNRELSALSPVSLEDQELDAELRADMAAPDVRYLIVVSAPDQESVLHAAERVGARLERLTDENVIGGFESPARYLPSAATQHERQSSLSPAPELRERLRQALVGMPLRAERLEPFVSDVESARTQPLPGRKDLQGTSLAAGFDALMLNEDGRWNALLPLRTPAGTDSIDVARIRQALSAQDPAPGVIVLDLKNEADQLYSTYLSEAVRLSLAGFASIVILLLFALRSPMRVIRVVAPLGLAVLAVAAGLVLLGRQLTILHVIGMLLIVAVGSNYALFFDRRSAQNHEGSVPLTLASLLIANATAVTSFGVLAFSKVPVLAALGSTVAPGALLALVFCAVMAKPLPEMRARQ